MGDLCDFDDATVNDVRHIWTCQVQVEHEVKSIKIKDEKKSVF